MVSYVDRSYDFGHSIIRGDEIIRNTREKVVRTVEQLRFQTDPAKVCGDLIVVCTWKLTMELLP